MTAAASRVDQALEASVIGSFTRLGPWARRRLFGWSTLPRVDGRVVVITGATSGIGLEAARALLALGARVEIVARDAGRAQRVAAALAEETGNPEVGVVVAEMGDLAAVRGAADALITVHARIDALVHNAGALDAVRGVSPQGIEQTVASQVLGPYLLTELLRGPLRAANPGRVIWVSSGGMYTQRLDVDRLEMPAAGYDGTVAYARAKRAQVTLVSSLAASYAAERVVVQAMHPGWVDTPGVARSLPIFRRVMGGLLRTPAEGADGIVWLAAADGPPVSEPGGFWLDRVARPIHRSARTASSDTPAERAKLEAWCRVRVAPYLPVP